MIFWDLPEKKKNNNTQTTKTKKPTWNYYEIITAMAYFYDPGSCDVAWHTPVLWTSLHKDPSCVIL